MIEPIMRDKFGNELNVGDYIVYARTVGRSADFGIGKILKIEPEFHEARLGRWIWVPEDIATGQRAWEYVMEHDPDCVASLTKANWNDRYKYYDPTYVMKPEHYTFKTRVASIQGFQFKHADTVDNRHTYSWTNEGTTNVTLQYPERMLKMDGFPEDIMKIFERENV